MKTFPSRKPHAENAGFVCELKCKLGGHIVVYDRKAGCGIDAEAGLRWIVMHEPSSLHVAIKTESQARAVMKGVAKARTLEEACAFADILPRLATNAMQADDAGAVDAKPKGSRQAERTAAEERADLERFLADPENEPSPEGKAALRRLFRLS